MSVPVSCLTLPELDAASTHVDAQPALTLVPNPCDDCDRNIIQPKGSHHMAPPSGRELGRRRPTSTRTTLPDRALGSHTGLDTR